MKEVRLRFKNRDGSSKDWMIRQLDNCLELEWGKTDKGQQHLTLALKDCPKGLSSEFQKRLNEQLKQGYEVVSQKLDESSLFYQVRNGTRDVSRELVFIQAAINEHLGPAGVSATFERNMLVVNAADGAAVSIPSAPQAKTAGTMDLDSPLALVAMALVQAKVATLANDVGGLIEPRTFALSRRPDMPEAWVKFLERTDVLVVAVDFAAFHTASLSVGF